MVPDCHFGDAIWLRIRPQLNILPTPVSASTLPDVDVTVVVRVCEDEERIGLVIQRLARHLRSLRCSFELLVADEGSGDNTVAIAVLLKPGMPELEVLHAAPGRGWALGCGRARGRALLLYDARSDAPLAGLGYALERLRLGVDVVAVSHKYLVLRRTRAWRAFDALGSVGKRRDPAILEARMLRRARALQLRCEVALESRRRRAWERLMALPRALFSPLATR